MKSRISEAVKRHDRKYNCAQAVACTYCDCFGIDEETMFKICEGLGAGMGGRTETCGALSGAVLLAGCKNSDGCLSNPATKGTTYALSKQIVNCFKQKVDKTVCAEIKGIGTGKVICSCQCCIETAAAAVEEILFAGQIEE